jgi:hypothetical protein
MSFRRTLISMISKKAKAQSAANLSTPEASEKTPDQVVQEEPVSKAEEPPAPETVETLPVPAQIAEEVLEEATQIETPSETEIAPEPLEEVGADDSKKKKAKKFGKD